MPLYVHQGSPAPTTRLVAKGTWALAVRAMVGRHDPDAEMAQHLTSTFIDKIRGHFEVDSSAQSMKHQRERLTSFVHASVKAADAIEDDGIVFTLFVTTGSGVRVFNLGPHRSYVAKVGGIDGVLLPHSVAEEVRKRGSDPEPQHALMSMRVANRHTTAEDIDAACVEIPADAWLVTQLDDRARPPVFSVLPTSLEAMVDALRDNARHVPNLKEDWLLATSNSG